jgi:hypothetical protein
MPRVPALSFRFRCTWTSGIINQIRCQELNNVSTSTAQVRQCAELTRVSVRAGPRFSARPVVRSVATAITSATCKDAGWLEAAACLTGSCWCDTSPCCLGGIGTYATTDPTQNSQPKDTAHAIRTVPDLATTRSVSGVWTLVETPTMVSQQCWWRAVAEQPGWRLSPPLSK